MTVHGVKVLVQTGSNEWRLERQCPFEAVKGTAGLGYRRSKRLEDTMGRYARWGSFVKGTDTGDGWLQLQVLRYWLK